MSDFDEYLPIAEELENLKLDDPYFSLDTLVTRHVIGRTIREVIRLRGRVQDLEELVSEG